MIKKRERNLIILSSIFSVSLILGFSISEKRGSEKELVSKSFEVAGIQYRRMLQNVKDLSKYPRTIDAVGNTAFVPITDWTGGFWPGNLWFLYEYTLDTSWKRYAIQWTSSLEKNRFNSEHHDIGFMMYCSYGNAYRITKEDRYKAILIQSAKSLISRYNPAVGCIKSWNYRRSWDGVTDWYYPVIIDNLMNLELLFFASKQTGDTIYRHVAIKHAETTMRNHFRSDNSSYHVVNYDNITGKVLSRQTMQGYSDNSTWARGQAWAIYGYTMIYRETKDVRFLQLAKRLADYYMKNSNLPEDKIPYWDFNVNQKGYDPQWSYSSSKLNYVPRDASSAAVVASALLELSGFLSDKGNEYREFAISTLKTLASPAYMASAGSNGNFLLKHCVGSFPHGVEIDVPLVYADYYFLEALLRLKKILS